MKKILYILLLFGLTLNAQHGYLGVLETQLKNLTNTTPLIVDVEAPTAPTDLTVSNITSTSVDLSWTASTDNVGVVQYALYNGSDSFVQTLTGTSQTITGLIPSTLYENYYIRAQDAAGNYSTGSNTVSFTTLADSYNNVRIIAMGASILYNVFYFESQIETQLLAENPTTPYTVEVHMEASPGETIGSYATGSAPNVDGVLANYSQVVGTKTYCVIHLGGNDVTSGRPYTSESQGAIDDMIADYTYIIDAIEAKGFTPIILDVSFRNYDGDTYLHEENGSLPYNEGFVNDLILNRSSEFAFNDGQSFMQFYNFMYNDWDNLLQSSDNYVHPAAYGPVKLQFAQTIGKYILTGVAPNKIDKVVYNPPTEQAYFDAHLVTAASASSLQDSIDVYNHVRLGKGDFSAAGNITLGSNQSIYGYPSQDGTELGTGNITISAGSSNVIIKNVDPNNIIFEAGSEISNVTINHVAKADIDCIGCRLTDSKIINIFLTELYFDNSASGYVRNTQVIRAYAQGQNDHVRWLGNTSEPSYGNIEMSRNFLTSTVNTSNYDGLQSHTLLGTDSENWDNTGTATRGPYYFRNCGQVNIFNSYGFSSPALAPEFDIEADLVWMQRKFVGSNQTPIFRTGTDVLYVQGDKDAPSYEGSNFYLEAYHQDNDIIFNGSDLSVEITGGDATTLSSIIYQTEHTPIAKADTYLPNSPAGEDWATDRVGQTDQSAEIQAMIDANDVAELDEGIYYISQPLQVMTGQGVIGKGTGKTAIVGITDDFPLIKVNDTVTVAGESTGQHHIIQYLTLQGGNYGYHVLPVNAAVERYMITNNTVKNVVFRNQTDGIRIEQIFGYDNNFFDSVSFVDCTNGIMEVTQPLANVPNDQDISYVDKTVFYNCQFINNTTALNMVAIRANNLNAWINCNFDGNSVAFNTTQSNALYVANSTFKNGTGSAVLTGNGARMSLYGCDFSNNSVTSLFDNKPGIYAEGCNFNDSGVDFFSTSSRELFMWNSNVESTINTSNISRGLFINTTVTGNAALSKPMVEIISATPLTILDGTVDVYPQLLVTH